MPISQYASRNTVSRSRLAHLASTTFDCVVMDLKLPDLSGAELLERMAAQDEVSFPPVIVYTGRTLTADEEQQLRLEVCLLHRNASTRLRNSSPRSSKFSNWS